MKKSIFILNLYLAIGIVTSYAQDNCDTLKWKTTETYYSKSLTNTIANCNKLDGAVINIDTLSAFYPGIEMVNISNDTFFTNTFFVIYSQVRIYADTGLITGFSGSVNCYFAFDRFPEDTLKGSMELMVNLNTMLNTVEGYGLTLENIDHLECIIGVVHTTRDGGYTDSIFYLGADTSIFYITKTPVNIQETEQSTISVFPNPAHTQFRVTNTEDASITLYNILGQEVKQIQGTAEQTTIYTDNLPAGIYVLKVEKEGTVFTKKVQVSD